MDTFHFVLAAVVLCSVPGGVLLQQVCPTGCACFDSLSFVECHNESITTLPVNLPANATSLDVSNNSLSIIRDREFSTNGGVNLAKLYLYYNNIAQIEDGGFDGLEDLIYIYLANNNITVFGKDIIKNNLKMDSLYLDNNPIILPASETASLLNSDSLSILSLEACNLTRLTPGLFSETPNIDALFLGYNRFTSFNWVDFNLNNLRVLYMNNNTMNRMFCDLELLISQNEIPDLQSSSRNSSGLATNETESRTVELSGNPFRCDCCAILTTYAMRQSFSSVVGTCTYGDGNVRDLDDEEARQRSVPYLRTGNLASCLPRQITKGENL